MTYILFVAYSVVYPSAVIFAWHAEVIFFYRRIDVKTGDEQEWGGRCQLIHTGCGHVSCLQSPTATAGDQLARSHTDCQGK